MIPKCQWHQVILRTPRYHEMKESQSVATPGLMLPRLIFCWRNSNKNAFTFPKRSIFEEWNSIKALKQEDPLIHILFEQLSGFSKLMMSIERFIKTTTIYKNLWTTFKGCSPQACWKLTPILFSVFGSFIILCALAEYSIPNCWPGHSEVGLGCWGG